MEVFHAEFKSGGEGPLVNLGILGVSRLNTIFGKCKLSAEPQKP